MFDDIDWFAGMVLKPQHFKIIKYFNYYKIFNILNIFNSNTMWGVILLEIDDTYIMKSIIVIKRLQAINIDGSVIDIDYDSFPEILTINISLCTDKFITVFVCSFKYDSSDKDKYVRTTIRMSDDNNIDMDEEMYTTSFKPFFLFEARPSYNCIPIMKLKSINNIYCIEEFNTVYAVIKSSSRITNKIKDVLYKIEASISKLYTSMNIYTAKKVLSFKSFDTIRTFDILNEAVTNIKTVISLDYMPIKLFNLVENLKNKIEILSSKDITTSSYIHENAVSIIEANIDKISTALEGLIRESNYTEEFIRYKSDNSLYTVIQKNNFISGNFILCCDYKSDTPSDRLNILEQLQNIQIFSSSFEDEVVKLRIKGAERKVYDNATVLRDMLETDRLSNNFYIVVSTQTYIDNKDNKLIIVTGKNLINNLNFKILGLNE